MRVIAVEPVPWGTFSVLITSWTAAELRMRVRDELRTD
jgi:hypothetical protein